MRSRKVDTRSIAKEISDDLKQIKITKKIIDLFSNKIKINKIERALLLDAINHRDGEIIEPANDDDNTMEIIVGLYDKGLVKIDFDNDKLFVSEIGKETLKR